LLRCKDGRAELDLEILALATFRPVDAIDALTKRLSLWR